MLMSQVFFACLLLSFVSIAQSSPRPDLPPEALAVLVNEQDPQSLAVAEYYKKTYDLADKNIIKLSFKKTNEIVYEDFRILAVGAEAMLPQGIEALAISWTQPYRVTFEKNSCAVSITSAFSFNDQIKKYCEQNNNYRSLGRKLFERIAGPSNPRLTFFENPLYEHSIRYPYSKFQLRPSMMLAGRSVSEVKKLIDRGHASRKLSVKGDLHFVLTRDKVRTKIRAADFEEFAEHWINTSLDRVTLTQAPENPDDIDFLVSEENIMFYFIGRQTVPHLSTNTFLPGAVGDHLTSFGGMLFDLHSQDTIFDWLEAGATGSFGTVIEPYGLAERFPKASILVRSYLSGETLIQAYWKSVSDPMLGLFVGDPLAKPYGIRD